MPVYVSLEGLPNNASLRMTGYWPGFVGSKSPGAAIAGGMSGECCRFPLEDVEVDVGVEGTGDCLGRQPKRRTGVFQPSTHVIRFCLRVGLDNRDGRGQGSMEWSSCFPRSSNVSWRKQGFFFDLTSV